MIGRFEVPLAFAVRASDPASIGAPPVVLSYRVDPVGKTQRRFADSVNFSPEIDLRRYRCRAAIDWIWLEFATSKPTQSVAIRNALVQISGPSLHLTGPEEDHDAAAVSNVTGTEFRLKLHDPRPDTIRAILSKLSERHGLARAARTIGIEVAVDWYARDVADEARWLMVGVLHGHHLPRPYPCASAQDDRRFTYARRTDFATRDRRFIDDRALDPGRIWADSDLKRREVRLPVLDDDRHQRPFIDSTVYLGKRKGPAMYRLQNKVADKRKSMNELVFLPPAERRARVEVTLLLEGAQNAGFGDADRLFGFQFRRLRRPHFQF